jgi:hypothetical protein
MIENPEYWLALGIAALVSGLGAYFGAYLKRKGENYATKEDVAEITRITKEIEAKISDDTWARQRRWDLSGRPCSPRSRSCRS